MACPLRSAGHAVMMERKTEKVRPFTEIYNARKKPITGSVPYRFSNGTYVVGGIRTARHADRETTSCVISSGVSRTGMAGKTRPLVAYCS